MAKARQQYFADETTLQKESREFAITPDIINKLDSIETGAQVNVIETVKVNGTALVPDANKAVNVEVPDVIDNLFSTSTDDALSAKQGKVLYDYLQNIASRGRYLSNWNCVTGLAITNPSESPYPYKSGDYFVVSNVAGLGGTNYRPDGTQYIIGQASTVVETDNVDVSDFYFYDGTTWLLLKNSSRSGAVDSALSTTSTNPVENRVVTNAINGKQDTLVAGTNIQIASDGVTISATDTTYSAGNNISIDANNEISAVDTTYTAGANIQISNQNVISATDTVYAAGTNVQINNNVISATDTTYTAGTGISIDSNNVISNTQTSAEWGNITGTLSNQIDLNNALSGKQDTLTAGTGINIGNINGRQGPAPDGFHIPSIAEWEGIKTIMDGLSLTTGDDWRVKLHIPFVGYRYVYNGSLEWQGSYGYYWSTTPYSTSPNLPSIRSLLIGSSEVNVSNGYSRAQAFSLRAFKDEFIVPDNSWTIIYGDTTSGIYWNELEGLISITSDGSTGYTIMDKNLGATTVYSDGDTLSEANMGYMYQWGNNYGFPSTGAISNPSTTQVDASSYGPGNYYSSSTYITQNDDWSSVRNDDLWGDITGTINNVISNTGVTSVNGQTGDVTISGAVWGNITGNITDQTDLNNALSAKANSSDVNTKTFTLSSTSDTTNATSAVNWYKDGNTPIIKMTLRTEPTYFYLSYDMVTSEMGGDRHILYFKSPVRNGKYEQIVITTDTSWSVTRITESEEDALSTQIAYTTKGTSTKVPTITTNTLGQVTAITETNIAFPVTSVNGSTGAVTVNDVKSSATAPSSPTEGMVWYDTTNDQLKVYDGTNWNVTGKEYNAGQGISIGDIIESDMKGPCASGFHIPSYTDWNNVLLALDTLGAVEKIEMGPETRYISDKMQEYLLLPKCGYRLRDNTNIISNIGKYYCCEAEEDTFHNNMYGYAFDFESRYRLIENGGSYTSNAFSIRPFKNEPVIPTSSWTVLFDGSSVATGAGVYHNSSLGLISISSNGTTWYTIADKNLGATTVRNYGDTTSEANCGKYYQWGNNYGFPGIGNTETIIISNTAVDVSSYGPGNYYSSNIFTNTGDFWTTAPNLNLWGGVSKGTYTELDNAITNTGVLSVNGQTGDVTLNAGDMNYSDFNWASKTGATITLDLASTISPSADFTVNAPSTIKDGQTYILRVNNEGTAYEMTLGTNVTNPYDTDITLTDDGVDQFVFLAINGELELQPEGGGGDYQLAPNSPLKPKYRWYGTQAQYDALTQYYTDEEGDTVYFTI